MLRFDLARFHKDRRRAQAGTTLVELLVSVVIMGLTLSIIVGTFSTGVIDATLAKRNTASQAIVQYELDKISGSPPGGLPAPYSDCFAIDDLTLTGNLTDYVAPAPCPGGRYSLRADIENTTPLATTQLWKVTVFSLLDGAQVGSPVWVNKVSR